MSSSKSFFFSGVVPASKSMMNRALICSSYTEDLLLQGRSACDDVEKMIQAMQLLKGRSKQVTVGGDQPLIYDCGDAGTVLRFLSLRLSRIPGYHVLRGGERLMQRPQQDLVDLLSDLGVEVAVHKTQMLLRSEGWKYGAQPIVVSRGVSSQFASGIILNAWGLPQDLSLKMVGGSVSEGYLEMTLQMVKRLGMRIENSENEILIKANSQVGLKEYKLESDWSSIFAVAAFAVLNGQAVFEDVDRSSLQPDVEFLEFFSRMEIPWEFTGQRLKILPVGQYKGLEANLKSCPDLFPVLAVLCSAAMTPSRLYGAPQLVHKESHRIKKVAELLNFLQIRNTPTSEGILIEGRSKKTKVAPFQFDTDYDHRLAFAAALVKSMGYPIQIINPEVVKKSYPEFWQAIALDPYK